MAFLVSSFGPVGGARWDSLLGEFADFPPANVWTARDPREPVRIGVVGPGGRLRSVHDYGADLAVAGEGALEGGEEDVAGVVLAAYRARGPSGVARLRGDHVFAVWDGRSRSLLVGCGGVGFRAPAYLRDGDAFIFSSKALALLRASNTRAELNRVYLAHALGGIWCPPADATPFEGVRRMKGGELLRVSGDGIEWLEGDRLRFDVTAARDRRAVTVELETRLDRATGAMAVDTGTCVLLSGGLDSAVVAALVARRRPSVDAYSLLAPVGSSGSDGAAGAVAAALPGVRHHRIEVAGDAFGPIASLPDDPMCTAPVLEVGRLALLRAASAAGFRRVFTGEGGDELFDLAWWSRDLIHEGAVVGVLARLARRASLVRIVNELAMGDSLGALGDARMRQLEGRLRRRKPWLRDAFWEGPGFAGAMAQARSYWKLRSIRERLPDILGSHGRTWRAHELTRLPLGVEAVSPLMDRGVVEFVGSLRADMVIDPHHGKALLRRLAARLMPAAIAWRPKKEPLSEWLAEGFISSDAHVSAALALLRESPLLRELVDPLAVRAAVDQARREPRPIALVQALVELFTLAEWIAMVQAGYGV